MGELYGSVINAMAKTSAVINKTFTASGSYTVPAGYIKADIFCVGGGSGGVGYQSGGGGGGGYTKTVIGIAVAAGQVLAITIGAGGQGGQNTTKNRQGYPGGVSTVTRSGTTICSAEGGTNVRSNGTNVDVTSTLYFNSGKNGGSGGGGQTDEGHENEDGYWVAVEIPKNGGSNGSRGEGTYSLGGGKGQGTTTRAYGQSSGTLYAGGGGAGRYNNITYGSMPGASGGAGGGGKGGDGAKALDIVLASGKNGAANTGGGGGGSGYNYTNGSAAIVGGDGGSGIVLVKLY